MTAPRRIVVVGAGLAGLRVVEALRRRGFDGPVTMVLGEPELPYDRPPLSKGVLTGERAPESTFFRPEEFFHDLGVDLVAGPAHALDGDRQVVEVGREKLPYDKVVLCTGAMPKRLAAAVAPAGLDGVHQLRTMDDARRLRERLTDAEHVVVIGGGFIGAEVASSARQIGCDVTVVEALPAPLERALGREMATVCASLHSEHGTRLLCGYGVAAVEGDEKVERVRLTSGEVLDCDLVLVCIGVTPDIDWLRGSGLQLGDGIVCDAYLRASLPGSYAAGDVAWWFNPLFHKRMRCEQWTNAAEQARHVAANILGGATGLTPFRGSNYFWSDQYGARIQFAGVTHSDEVRIVWGKMADRRFLALYRGGHRVVGAFGMNAAKQLMEAKALVEASTEWCESVASFDPQA